MSVVKYGRGRQYQFRSDFPMSDDLIARHAPSIFAEAPHQSRGERYAFIPTAHVLAGLRNEGFQVFEVRQTLCRNLDKRPFTKHLMRMRHPDARHNGDGEVPEIILVNSHDGTSSYQLIAGVFRMICSNGLIAGDICQDVRVRHSGRVVDDVIEGSFRVIDELKEVTHHIDSYKALPLSEPERRILVEEAHRLRWDAPTDAPVEPEQLLMPRRWEDRGKSDLWTTFNTVQENLVKGGIQGRAKTGRRTTTREIGGVNENVKLNRALWSLTERMAALKEGRPLPDLAQA